MLHALGVYLQSDPIQIGIGLLSLANTGLLLGVAFRAGQWTQKIVDLARRVASCEMRLNKWMANK